MLEKNWVSRLNFNAREVSCSTNKRINLGEKSWSCHSLKEKIDFQVPRKTPFRSSAILITSRPSSRNEFSRMDG